MVYVPGDLRYCFYELSEILRYMPIGYNKKLPEKFKTLINENKISNGFAYNIDKSLDNQEMLYDTKVLLSILYRTYWCSDEKRRELEEKDNNILKNKYSYENLFKEKNKIGNFNEDDCKSLEVVQDKWYQKLMNFIKKCVKRKK